ncbi:peptide deformylase [Primorskyibacter aestuariivivens]|uniref:peptide deformylase n=1 Tax=Primorskyibacter aestuariivivens TaxID=1888912 RepID=UPI002301D623|nr:peptide deformylase [Primorskyibacter aestuariivivens]MDA7427329.1 peptide deformylase [Primorskyibacter aestuariivivens]
MAVLPIRAWPDPVLKRVCDPVTDDVTGLVADMFETMYDAPGRGLAAPQVGVPVRLFVMDAGWKDGDMTSLACINPEIVAASEALAGGEEACLSIAGVAAEVQRPAEITLRFTDLNGEVQERALTGAEAKCAQHELDHLDGRVIFDHLAPDAAEALEAQYLTLRRRA